MRFILLHLYDGFLSTLTLLEGSTDPSLDPGRGFSSKSTTVPDAERGRQSPRLTFLPGKKICQLFLLLFLVWLFCALVVSCQRSAAAQDLGKTSPTHRACGEGGSPL